MRSLLSFWRLIDNEDGVTGVGRLGRAPLPQLPRLPARGRESHARERWADHLKPEHVHRLATLPAHDSQPRVRAGRVALGRLAGLEGTVAHGAPPGEGARPTADECPSLSTRIDESVEGGSGRVKRGRSRAGCPPALRDSKSLQCGVSPDTDDDRARAEPPRNEPRSARGSERSGGRRPATPRSRICQVGPLEAEGPGGQGSVSSGPPQWSNDECPLHSSTAAW